MNIHRSGQYTQKMSTKWSDRRKTVHCSVTIYQKLLGSPTRWFSLFWFHEENVNKILTTNLRVGCNWMFGILDNYYFKILNNTCSLSKR